MYDVSSMVMVAASAYAVRGSGEQRVVSRVVRPLSGAGGILRNRNRVFETQPEAVTLSDAVNDHGFSTWFSISPRPEVDFHAGYSRSVSYAYNSIFFGIGFRIGQ